MTLPELPDGILRFFVFVLFVLLKKRLELKEKKVNYRNEMNPKYFVGYIVRFKFKTLYLSIRPVDLVGLSNFFEIEFAPTKPSSTG